MSGGFLKKNLWIEENAGLRENTYKTWLITALLVYIQKYHLYTLHRFEYLTLMWYLFIIIININQGTKSENWIESDDLSLRTIHSIVLLLQGRYGKDVIRSAF